MRGDSHVRCGGRAGETGRRKLRNRAPARPYPDPAASAGDLRRSGHMPAFSPG
jgi:hypothetical protein